MASSVVETYLKGRSPAEVNPQFIAYLANLQSVASVAPGVAASIVQELADQRSNIKLIASENYSSLACQLAMGNLLTDKYAEGIPQRRYYAGCDNVDDIETFACEQACQLFGADHAYVQPHSGADANIVAFWAILSARVETPAVEELGAKSAVGLSAADWETVRAKLGNQRLLAMDFSSGGHLTHGYRLNISAKMFEAHGYTVSPDTYLLDYDAIERQAEQVRPLILLAGFSAYPRRIDFARMRAIADKVGAVLMVDMAHFAGLVAGGVLDGVYDPVAYAHVVTTTTHKTLRGPRGGLILCTREFADYVDRGCPMVQGGPLPHILAAKGVCFTEALRPEFKDYAARIVRNARALGESLAAQGLKVLTGGTDNHQVIVDVTPSGLTGRQAEAVLRECGVTSNRNAIAFDKNSPLITSGLRLGTPAVTTLGMSEADMGEIGSIIDFVLRHAAPATTAKGDQSKIEYVIGEGARTQALERVGRLLSRYPVYPELDLEFLQAHFRPAGSAGAARKVG